MTNDQKPVIGITGPDRGGGAAWFFTMISVRLAGGRPKRISPSRKFNRYQLSGIILGGGADINPDLYGEVLKEDILDEEIKKEKVWKRLFQFFISLLFFPLILLIRKMVSVRYVGIDNARDELEVSLLEMADREFFPVLGICRGMQLINTFYKGTLYQDISEFYGEKPQITTLLPKKKIIIKENSCLRRILNLSECRVNALHKQAIDKTGTGIIISAKEETGIVQAIEHQYKTFMLGVQWHPEYLIQVKEQRNIFHELVRIAKLPKEKRKSVRKVS